MAAELTSRPLVSIARIVRRTEAEGPGERFAIWLQGCSLHCTRCCNPEMLPRAGGTILAVDELLAQLQSEHEQRSLAGITLLGGEPFEQPGGAAAIAAGAQGLGLTVLVFTGYEYEDLQERDDPSIQALLAATDLLIDGPYREELPEPSRRWIGSANQRTISLTDRISLDPAIWEQRNTLELRLTNGELTVNGFPAAQAAALWQQRRTS